MTSIYAFQDLIGINIVTWVGNNVNLRADRLIFLFGIINLIIFYFILKVLFKKKIYIVLIAAVLLGFLNYDVEKYKLNYNYKYDLSNYYTEDYFTKEMNSPVIDTTILLKNIRIKGNKVLDQHNREVFFKGINLSGSTKYPYEPKELQMSYNMDKFYTVTGKGISFIGRPVPLDEADEHFYRLHMFGYRFLRLLVTWEAVEHDGPGIYDYDYLEYLKNIVKIAKKYEISVFIDPHQDVWSRFTGGDGAPAWTLEVAGFNIKNLHKTGAAYVHQEVYNDKKKLIRMAWPVNYGKLACATMFTLFFAGNEFAPLTPKINGNVTVQDFLQDHYINAMAKVAEILKDEENVLGYDTLNEPSNGFVTMHNLEKNSFPAPLGFAASAFQGMVLGAGKSVNIDVFTSPMYLNHTELVNPNNFSAWISEDKDIWRQNKVWKFNTQGEPELLEPNYFAVHRKTGKEIDFLNDFMLPFWKKFDNRIRKASNNNKDLIIYLEPHINPLNPTHEKLHQDIHNQMNSKKENLIYTPHFYDASILILKKFIKYFALDMVLQFPVVGPDSFVTKTLCKAVTHMAHTTNSQVPILVGETGIPFDLEDKISFKTSDFLMHIFALERTMVCLENDLLHYTLWNYTPDNNNKFGDGFNDEDLSIYSKDQKKTKDIYSGGRALPSVIRPYAMFSNGELMYSRFFPLNTQREYKFILKLSNKIVYNEPTIVFVPKFQYLTAEYKITSNDTSSTYKKYFDQQLLLISHKKPEAVGIDVFYYVEYKISL